MEENTEQVGTEEVVEETTESTPVEEVPVEEPKSQLQQEVERLRQENQDQQSRINKYDGERSEMSGKMNNLEAMMQEMQASKTAETVDEEYLDSEPVTKAELAEFKKGETDRFKNYNESERKENEAYDAKYYNGFASASIDSNVDNDTAFEILKEHDAMVNAKKMPPSTGNPELDARIAYEKAENVFLKKRLAAGGGEVKPFNTAPAAAKLGVGSASLGDGVVKKSAAMPKLPADAQELVNTLGVDADFVSGALSRK